MYDSAFDLKTLGREFVKADFKADQDLIGEDYRRAVVAKAREQASLGFEGFSLKTSFLRGKPTYQVVGLDHALVMRKFSRNIRRLTRVKQSDRSTIIKSLKQILSEGHHFRAYKLDLKNFYESIDRSGIEAQLRRDGGLAPPTLRVFQFIDAALTAEGVSGLPRGLSVSAVLSEYVMRSFDQTVKSIDTVYYFARYVDDIIVLTTGKETKKTFLKKVRESLPMGVHLNHAKTRTIDFNKPKVNNATNQTIEDVVDFLGYRFSVYLMLNQNRSLSRRVHADISPNKITRFKTRIALSALQFAKDNNFNDFRDRIRVLSGNYNVYDFDRKIRRNVGIYFNYRFLDLTHSSSLPELDSYLKKLLLSHEGKIATSLRQGLTPQQRHELLKLTFQRSFTTRNFAHFQIGRLTHLVGCWAYE